MRSFKTNNYEFCSKRKSFFMTGCLIFVLLMAHASGRPSKNDDVAIYNDGDYTDADDTEWQNFPISETTTKGHPIIYYKEDIVSEDYDPNKENKSSSKEHKTDVNPSQKRKYKNILRRNRFNHSESYRYIKPEKVYFDVYPIEDDGAKEYDTKLNAKDISVEIISLVDGNKSTTDEENSDSKHLLVKRPKKYNRRHRQRRDVTPDTEATDESTNHALRHKRNPFSVRFSYYGNQLPFYHGVFHQPQVIFYPTKRVKYPIRGVYHNAGSPNFVPAKRITTTTTITAAPPTDQMPDIVNRIGEPIWDSSPMTTPRNEPAGKPQISGGATKPPRRPPPPIIHSGDEDYVPPPAAASSNNIPSRQRTTTYAPSTDFDGSAFAGRWRPQEVAQVTPAPSFRPVQTTPAPSAAQESESSSLISTCIWAISSCCTRRESISYRCFERLGCSGAFWDLNPCAEDIYRLAVNAADQYLS